MTETQKQEETAIVRSDFGGQEIVPQAETAASAVAAQAQAAIQARYIMAVKMPRDMDTVRLKLLKECSRPGFSEVARYAKPVGTGSVAGFSIRFAEAAARCYGNVLSESVVTFDDAKKRIVRVITLDLESNLTYQQDIVVEKTVERKKLRQGQTAISTRKNSYGDTVYIVEATEDEIATKQAAQISKVLRNGVLRMIPGDILDECESKVLETIKNQAAKDPDAERKKLADGFAALGVMPKDLKDVLGRDLSTISPAEIIHLRSIYSAIKAGEATWQEISEEHQKAADDGQKTGLASLTAKLQEARKDLAETKPAAKADPPCEKHPDVDPGENKGGEYWKCQAESNERNEAAKAAFNEAGQKGLPLQRGMGKTNQTYRR